MRVLREHLSNEGYNEAETGEVLTAFNRDKQQEITVIYYRISNVYSYMIREYNFSQRKMVTIAERWDVPGTGFTMDRIDEDLNQKGE